MKSSGGYIYKMWLFWGSVLGVLKYHNIRVMENTFELQSVFKKSIGEYLNEDD